MKLYNTLSRQLDELEPSAKQAVRMYVCGVTVYDESHIGHARTIIVFDTLRRYLQSKGLGVYFVQNFTDVDDKIINRAKSENRPAGEISSRYIARYMDDFRRLNVLDADAFPKATEHIREMTELIDGLVKKGHAYVTLNGVYFRVRSFPGYGKLSRKPIEELESGARIEVDATKEDPLDFALWKFYSEPLVWDSPWGKGRPGWHIECSAMALKYLGDTFEIHGGGHDLVFPHHENEIAQSEAYTGKPFARIWMHSGMVTINSQKMSKSLGNIVTIQSALARWGTNSLRLYCLSVHYSKPLDYTDELLQESVQRWRQIETCGFELFAAAGSASKDAAEQAGRMAAESLQAFRNAMDDDLNTALATTEFMKFVTRINQMAASDKLTRDIADAVLPAYNSMMDVFGLRLVMPGKIEVEDIERQIADRNRLRSERKFKDADDIRNALLARSIELMDHRGRTVWKKVEHPE